ncbi:hypothetical protein PHYPSEUDO_001289 [Phytophthora pseudosyringae]|uniref:Uncharacterized protein n=1 Tax=Phytophthora pseudosyringae TaxID=221518 RepID=A0A8T1V395_9STRA|nr:hypothetical protein PHYPSEUDO_001289 [Phytophthora pseudosyringae]
MSCAVPLGYESLGRLSQEGVDYRSSGVLQQVVGLFGATAVKVGWMIPRTFLRRLHRHHPHLRRNARLRSLYLDELPNGSSFSQELGHPGSDSSKFTDFATAFTDAGHSWSPEFCGKTFPVCESIASSSTKAPATQAPATEAPSTFAPTTTTDSPAFTDAPSTTDTPVVTDLPVTTETTVVTDAPTTVSPASGGCADGPKESYRRFRHTTECSMKSWY